MKSWKVVLDSYDGDPPVTIVVESRTAFSAIRKAMVGRSGKENFVSLYAALVR